MSTTDRHRQRCEREATRDVIFLFQTRTLTPTGWLPEGYDWDPADGGIYCTGEASGERFPVPLVELYGRHGSQVAHSHWQTIGVWLDRDEAEAWGRSQQHNHGHQCTPLLETREDRLWRVYGVPAEGQLARLLQQAGALGIPGPDGEAALAVACGLRQLYTLIYNEEPNDGQS